MIGSYETLIGLCDLAVIFGLIALALFLLRVVTRRPKPPAPKLGQPLRIAGARYGAGPRGALRGVLDCPAMNEDTAENETVTAYATGHAALAEIEELEEVEGI